MVRICRQITSALWTAWSRVVQAVFGAWEWQAPAWMLWLQHRVTSAAALSRRNPRRAFGVLVTVAALSVGSVSAWRWYLHRPKPQFVHFVVTAPGRTAIERENSKPDPLIIRFDRSAAALGAIGKDVPTGITMTPAIPGSWHWTDDRVLEFRVRDDWPIGQHVDVDMAVALFGPQTRLEKYSFVFDTAPFTAHITHAELYQDPTNPGIKNSVFDVEFSHPVDPTEFEQRVELRLAGQQQGVLGIGRETTRFTVVYDKLKLHASVHSATLPIPKEPTSANLTLKPGTRAMRGGNRLTGTLSADVRVPGLYSLEVLGTEPLVVNNAREEPEQVLLINLSAATGERDVARAAKAWLLPTVRAAQNSLPAQGSDDEPYDWYSPSAVSPKDLADSQALSLTPVPAEREFVESHSFRYHADVGRYLYVEVTKNLTSFGGYLSAQTQHFVVRVPPFPPQLALMSQGSILALSGDHKVVAMMRDIPGLEITVGRLLPSQIQHLVSQSYGDFSHPQFSGGLDLDNLVERYHRKIPLPGLGHGETHYETVDLGGYLKNGSSERRGIFMINVAPFDPKAEERQRRAQAQAAAQARQPTAADRTETDAADDSEASADGESSGYEGDRLSDQRLIVVTDLGLILKKSNDGTLDVFVQSVATGHPVAGAGVEIVAKNGTSLANANTDASGRAHFAALDSFQHEQTPLLVQATKDSDMSFMPLNRGDRYLDLSRFDVGGIRSARNAHEISSYLFSDRGLYRPGETIHVAMITKTADWSKSIAGIPLEAEVLDARGLPVKRERLRLPAGGFTELNYPTSSVSPTGTYTVNLYIVKDNRPDSLIGTTSVRVQEFEPDRMKIALHLSSESPDGWISPADMKALVNVQNLFGTPAENRRVEGTLTLTPAYPAFRRYSDYKFYDPMRTKEGYSDQLKDTLTDAQGNASFDLGLQKYANATYRVHVLARAFEPQGGRSVTAETATLVSEQPFLVGYKSDGGLDYLPRGSTRMVELIAIDPKATKIQAADLTLSFVQSQYLSVLIKQPNGTYKYESRKKDTTVSEQPLTIAAAGNSMPLDTKTAGTFAYVIHDAAGVELNRIEYAVAGAGNVTRSLERNAELQLTLSKKDYAPGEDIEISIKAPYTGAGLITIERDHVYATQWFKADTTASVQKIKLPADFEGNGYVSVQFVRDPASDEIFTSPLSYGIAPFMTSLSARTNVLTLKTPDLVKPGSVLNIKLNAAQATRAVVFAVDEGILEVAHYRTPDPLADFFKKRALEVRTSQILDLILPEFKRIMAAAAPGGDAEAAIKRNLNPFKRKRAKPAVYWSGIVDVPRDRDFTWTIPDTFNGSLKVFAISVDEGSIGVATAETTVRGDFVLTPNMPAAVAPGDEFDISVGLANSLAESGKGADILLRARLPATLESVGPAEQTLKIDALHEGVATFRVRARAQLGAVPITFEASWRDRSAKLTDEISIRPATPNVTDIRVGSMDTAADIPVTRDLYPNYRKLKVGVSSLPLALAGGFADYLGDYPHLCTEQMTSAGFASLVLARRPELMDPEASKPKPGERTATLVATLRSRQNDEGGFGLWAATVETDEFASVYAIHWLLEAREQGESIPDDLLQRSLAWLQQYAASPVPDTARTRWDMTYGLWGVRNRAYAAYLLTRRGTVTTPIVASLRQTLEARYPKEWRTDVTAAYLGAIHQLQKQEREADKLMEPMQAQLGRPTGEAFYAYYGDTVRDATVIYLLARHFPARIAALAPKALDAVVAPLSSGNYNTLSSARMLTAIDAYATHAPSQGLDKFSASEISATQQRTPIALSGQLVLQGRYGETTKTVHVDNATGLTGYYSLTSAGFDRQVPAAPEQLGIEIVREYLDAEGKPIQSVKTGQEIIVRLRLRSLERDYIPNIAIIDLLPGGFEPVLQLPGADTPDAATPATGDRRWFNRLGNLGNWSPDYAEVRDDRVVLYGMLSKSLAEYSYKIRATNSGTFTVAPSVVQSMYDRSLRARTAPGSVTVVQPPAP